MQDLLPLTIRYSAIPEVSAQELDMVAGPILQTGLAQSIADGVYLYRLDSDQLILDLVSSRGLSATSIQPFEAQSGPGRWLLSLKEATQVGPSAWQDWRLEALPEFAQNRFEAAIAMPLSREGRLSGILTAARLRCNVFAPREVASLRVLAAPIEGLLAVAAAREENARLKSELVRMNERFAERKHIERAKGIFQSRHGWTEEEAYLHLRRLSRNTRKPMGEIARCIVVHSTSGTS